MIRFQLASISRYRQELMGFSAILILICHAVGNGVQMPDLIRTVLNFGNIGVDMFLFLSGMGMYYSLQTNRVWGGVISWYIRRYKRIVVPYLVIAMPFYLFKVMVGDCSVGDALYDLSTVSYWTHHRSAWFIALLFPLYALTPLFARLIDGFKYRWVPSLVLCTVCLVFGAAFSGTENDVLANIANAVRRVPGFFVGYWMGKGIKDGVAVSVWGIGVMPVVVCGLLYMIPFNVYSFWLMMFPLICLLIWIYEHRVKWFQSLCLFMGTITLESYLTNGYSATVLRHLSWQWGGIDWNYGNYAFYVCVLAVGVLWSLVANKISNRIMNKSA